MSDLGSRWAEVVGYNLDLDRYYDPHTDVWVLVLDAGRVRLGMDPLGVETSGSLAQISLLPPGTEVARGESLGSVEAEKFVGPLVAPVSGTIVGGNQAAIADPRIVHGDPLGAGWLVEMAPSDLAGEAPLLVHGAEQVAAWFEAKVEDYRLRGVLAE